MNLRVIFLPFFIVMSIIMSVGFVKPEIDSVMQLRANTGTKKTELARINQVASHVKALIASLQAQESMWQKSAADQQKSRWNPVMEYLPSTVDQDRIVDSINYIAYQSGVTMTGLDVTLIPGSDSPAVATPSATTPAPTARIFPVKAIVTGEYPSLKMFFDKLWGMGRMHSVSSVDLSRTEKTEGSGDKAITKVTLTGALDMRFDYLSPVEMTSALQSPVFDGDTLDFSVLSNITSMGAGSAALPELRPAGTGKGNPFEF